MDFFEQSAQSHLQAFATSLALGFLIGLERERNPDARAGLRTFALVALFGNLAGLIGSAAGAPWLVGVGLLAVAAMIIAAYQIGPVTDRDPGTTSIVALLICYALGAAVWFGFGRLAVMLAIATTALLYFKTELHGLSRSLSAKDIISILQFAVLSFIVLPVLPDKDYGPYNAFNPHQIWWMVVLISGVSLAGYAALRIVGQRYGAAVIGLFGGLVSSTATTMVFARNARGQPDLVTTATLVILIANLMVMVRLTLISAVLAPSVVVPLASVLGTGLVAGLLVSLKDWRGVFGGGDHPMPEVGNPTELRTALTFGGMYALILLLAAWLQDIAGSRGIFLVALVSGLTDVDAITLTSLRMFNQEKLTAVQTVTSISLAILSNLCFKTSLVVFIGRSGLARGALPGFAAVGIGIGAALLLI